MICKQRPFELIQLPTTISDEGGASKTVWSGKWFPKKPGDADQSIESNNLISNGDETGKWIGKWFPNKPVDTSASPSIHSREGLSGGKSVKKQLTMGILDPKCDDTKVMLSHSPC